MQPIITYDTPSMIPNDPISAVSSSPERQVTVPIENISHLHNLSKYDDAPIGSVSQPSTPIHDPCTPPVPTLTRSPLVVDAVASAYDNQSETTQSVMHPESDYVMAVKSKASGSKSSTLSRKYLKYHIRIEETVGKYVRFYDEDQQLSLYLNLESNRITLKRPRGWISELRKQFE